MEPRSHEVTKHRPASHAALQARQRTSLFIGALIRRPGQGARGPLRVFVTSWFILLLLSSSGFTAEEIGENVAGAKGLDDALSRLRAPLRETDPLPPQETLKALKPLDGLTVDLIAAEPVVRQPLYLTFDERGRMWVIQYIQYPFPAGLKVVEYDQYIRAKFDKVPPPPPNHFRGKDVISVHEDADGDGTFEKSKTFLDGLSIATAALPGRGGMWVMNPPYLLFYPDKDRDDVPDADPVVHLSGFGLEDTHAVASSLMWGPDGWIYGAHGSTCTAKVKVEIQNPQSKIQNPRTTDFLGQCIWRYHPERHVFEIYAEGGGNTFGVAFDDAGRVYSGTNWGNFRGLHYVQGGYYVKGWGKHGPLTNPYAFGFFDHMPHTGNAERLTHTFDVYGGGLLGERFEGKIIGPSSLQSRVHVTSFKANASTYKTSEEPFLLTSDDGWFRPVDLKTGPDGGVYLADLYEKRISHVDPRDNWHRDTGRIWRVRRTDKPPGYKPFDLASLPSGELVELLDHNNRWYRATARRILGDRKDTSVIPTLREALAEGAGRRALEALWALNEVGGLDEATALAALGHAEPTVRMWAVRLIGDRRDELVPAAVAVKLTEVAGREGDPQVRSQLASTAKRLAGEQALPVIARLVRHDADLQDPHIPLLLWWAVESKAVSHREPVLAEFGTSEAWSRPQVRGAIMQRLARRYAADETPENQKALVRLFDAAPGEAERDVLLAGVAEAFEGRAIGQIIPELSGVLARSGNVEIALRGGDAKAHAQVLEFIRNDEEPAKPQRTRYIELLGQVGRPEAAPVLLDVAVTSRWHSVRRAALAALTRFDDATVGERIVAMYGKLPADQDVRPAAVAALVSRPAWAATLLKAVRAGAVPKADIPADQVARIRGYDDKGLLALADEVLGKEQKPSSEQMLKEFERVKRVVLTAPGDPAAGKALYTARCAACHVMFGEGGKVGPDLSGYERDNLDAIVLNVVDPSAYIREEFQTFLVRTKSGQSFVGVVTQREADQIALVDAAGRQTVVAKSDITAERASPASIMPEGLLADLNDKQVQDLFAFLASKPK